MCDPVSITMGVGLATSMATGMMQQYQAAQNQAGMIEARNESNRAEAERQRSYQAESDKVFGDTLSRFQDDPDARRQEAIGKREATIMDARESQSDPYNPSFGGANAPQIVKSELARKAASILAAGKDKAKGLAKMGGMQDYSFGNMINLGRTGNELGDIGTRAMGSARLLPIEQQTAITNAYDPPSPWWEVGKVAGQTAMFAAPYMGGAPTAPAVNNVGSPLGKNGMYGRV